MANPPASNSRFSAALKSLAVYISLVIISLGLAVIWGWVFEISWLKSLLPGAATMKANTAVAFIAAGWALCLQVKEQAGQKTSLVARGCALFVALIGLVTLAEYGLGVNGGIDQILFPDPATPAVSFPGRMSLITAVDFTLLGLALSLLDIKSRKLYRPAQLLAVFVAGIAFLALVGYLYGVESLYKIGPYSSISVHTALGFVLLGLAVLFIRPQQGLMKIVLADTAGGLTIRRLLPVVIVMPVVLGALRLWGQRVGYYDTSFGLTLMVVSMIVLMVVVIWLTATSLHYIDIHREQTAHALQQTEESFMKIFYNNPVAISVTSLSDGKFVEVNDSAIRFYGYDREELIGHTTLELGIFPHADERARIVDAIKEQGTIHNFDATLRSKDGVAHDVLVSSELIEFNDEPHILGMVYDITDRKKAEDRFRRVVEAMPTAIVMVDEKGRIGLANARAREMFGYSAEELVGKSIESLVPERFRSTHSHLRKGYFEGPQARPMGAGRELFGLQKDGREIPIEIGLNPVQMPGELFVLASIIDITERKRMEADVRTSMADLERSNKELEQFAYVASHDLQEPLRMVSSYMQLLSRRYQGKLDSDADEFIGFAVEGANRMKVLINDLLAFSRVGTRGKEFAPVALDEIFDQALRNLELAVEDGGVAVTHDPLPTVLADDGQMLQLFQNLIGNAIKFRDGPSPKVHVGVRRQDGRWLLFVRDNGIGLDPQFSERIFVIFQRLHSREEYQGTGIGLAIARKIVERHGGRIWVESQPGKGATFYFTLTPVDEAEPANGEEAPVDVKKPAQRDAVADRADDLI